MKFTREFTSALMVRSVGDGQVRIGNNTYSGTVALTPEAVRDDWTEKALVDIQADDFETLLDSDTELVILGTGATNQFAPRELVFAFARRGIGLEVMDSKAAARTFNVLAGEGRRVVVVLYA